MFNKKIAYNSNWLRTMWIGLGMGITLPLIIVLLEPFDAGQYEASYKYLRIFGYAVVIAFGVVAFHAVENWWYKNKGSQWRLWQEILFLSTTTPLIIALCGLYNFYVVNDQTDFQWNYLWNFLLYFGLPFAPFMIPVWAAMRRHFGKMNLDSAKTVNAGTITILGDNKADSLKLNWDDFLYAQAQQNYVKFCFIQQEEPQSELIRSTLAKVSEQLPDALQVHRSYLINARAVVKVQGNSRNRTLLLKAVAEPIPVSKKYFEAFQNKLANSSLE